MNVVGNAIKFTDVGAVRITASVAGDAFELAVSDTGPGIGEEEAKKIFEPFYTTKDQGLGLGMPYARKVIDQHGGTISLRSQPGQGTTISIALPAAQKEGDDAS